MKIIFSVGHPGHVHLFKNVIMSLQGLGHEVLVCAREKDVTIELLEKYNIEYTIISKSKHSCLHLIVEQYHRLSGFLRIMRRFQPNLSISTMDPSLAFASRLLNVPYVCLADTEHARASIFGALPFTDAILTPTSFRKQIGPKQISYKGYHELAYLHPNQFSPDPKVLDEIGLAGDNRFIIVRFVSWQASHDVGQHGIRDKIGLVKTLERYGRVLITSEGELPPEMQPYRIRVSPEKLHDLLYYATLYVGEGATTASECAVLGTHAIYVNTLGLGYISEEAEKYHLVSDFSNRICTDEAVIAEAKRLLENDKLKQEGKQKRDFLLNDKIDVTAFMVWFIEHYPSSIDIQKETKIDNSSNHANI